jgi:hypothetical protein
MVEHRDRPASYVHTGRQLKQLLAAGEVRLTQDVAQISRTCPVSGVTFAE